MKRKPPETRPEKCMFCPNPWKLVVVRLTIPNGFSFDFCHSCLLHSLLTSVLDSGSLKLALLRKKRKP